jgi:hypothetical protein
VNRIPPTRLGFGALVVATALAAAGCGSSKPRYESTAPCLRGLGSVFDHGRPLSLPFVNPFNPQLGRMASPRTFEHWSEVSFVHPGVGANAVQLFFFDGDDAASRVRRRIVTTRPLRPFTPRGVLFRRGARVEARDDVLVLWSSSPTGSQVNGLADCLG